MNGYFGIGIYNSKTPANIGTLWRSAYNFGASFIFTIGARYKGQSSDTVLSYKKIPFFEYKDFSELKIPYSCQLIGIEQSSKSKPIQDFKHPSRAIYLLGAEDTGLPPKIQDKCQSIIHIDTPMCLNVATAGSIIMYDRSIK